MNLLKKILCQASVILVLCALESCEREIPVEITDQVLSHCLTPTSLKATVENDYDVTFSWTATKDADSYNLLLYTDEMYEDKYMEKSLLNTEVPYTVTLEPGMFYYKVQAVASDRDSSKWAYCNKPVVLESLIKAVNLSSNETANCYVVSDPGIYKFRAVKGCSQETVSVADAVLIWETSTEDFSSVLEVNSIIKNLEFDKEYITFTVPSPLKPGNALIAAKNSSGTILWSWHIWVIADQPGTINLTEDFMVMDRNLGELGYEPQSRTSLLYQWGRKDPFPGVNAEGKLPAVAGAKTDYTNSAIDYKTAIANPTLLYGALSTSSVGAQPYGLKSGDDNFWGSITSSEKTMYDPCPAGYKVPHAWNNAVVADNVLTGTRFEILNSLDFLDEGRLFRLEIDPEPLGNFSCTGYILMNTDISNYSKTSQMPVMDGNSFHFWTASRINKRLAAVVRCSDVDGVSFWAKAGDNDASYQSKNNAYAIRCEKIR